MRAFQRTVLRNSFFLVMCVGVGSGCAKLLGFEEPIRRSDGGLDDGGVPDAVLGIMTVINTRMTSMGPEGASTGGLHILDPRFDVGERACGVTQVCVTGGITP